MATETQANAPPITTADELLRAPESLGPSELVRGELVMMTPAGSEHGGIEGNVFFALRLFNREKTLGKVFPGDTGFLLFVDPDTVRSPDVAFVAAPKVPSPLPKGFFPCAPDLAVEILSDSNSAGAINDKIDQYFEAGTTVVWLIDPELKTVRIVRPDAPMKVLREGDTVTEPTLLPEFELAVAEIFEQ